ncbi:uncharacterized protein K460DRAFT_417731 [Cucurbitaria berberidis CBS 394.84]|uniref:Uncharacterized protein n=1 Tax=Cucurbitaria berberidis CBS 394.84 TaxID=1168544 RepID=A0A9P4L9U0_9PLEO|nr:uncharacterized protein K460DRAFT_417731 [Cucurbitaria berberidis CBS 394.84]KAF1846697.1 hypothetical protein K460DRAFT_417731 [Cucurbitaria berberidis CBS 394.84]
MYLFVPARTHLPYHSNARSSLLMSRQETSRSLIGHRHPVAAVRPLALRPADKQRHIPLYATITHVSQACNSPDHQRYPPQLPVIRFPLPACADPSAFHPEFYQNSTRSSREGHDSCLPDRSPRLPKHFHDIICPIGTPPGIGRHYPRNNSLTSTRSSRASAAHEEGSPISSSVMHMINSSTITSELGWSPAAAKVRTPSCIYGRGPDAHKLGL